jgi:gamma-glutamylcyclotransferase (GGCT)/AIG2-like uncharacterized protein YtfP
MSSYLSVVKNVYDERASSVLAECDKVFVYGTLKREYGNSRLFDGGGGDFLSVATTKDNFLLLDHGCPMALVSHTSDLVLPVKGEVWKVNNAACMARLDRLEGEGYLYHRVLTKTDDGEDVWMYQVFEAFGNDEDNLSTIEDGAWVWP